MNILKDKTPTFEEAMRFIFKATDEEIKNLSSKDKDEWQELLLDYGIRCRIVPDKPLAKAS